MIEKIFIILVLILSVVQVLVSPRQSLLYRSEMDLVKTQERMIDYPPKFYRLAHILEERKESIILNRIKNNFFEIFNLKIIYLIFIPFLIIGFFEMMEKRKFGLLIILLGLPIVILSVLGVNKVYGNFCLYPFLLLSLIYGFNKIFYKK